jgi:hypothetical protein
MVARAVSVLLWGLVGGAKGAALVSLFTGADAGWRDGLAWLMVAYGLVAVALAWRARMAA